MKVCENCSEIFPDSTRKLIYGIHKDTLPDFDEDDLEIPGGTEIVTYFIVDETFFKKNGYLRDLNYRFPEIPFDCFHENIESGWAYSGKGNAEKILKESGIKFSKELDALVKE